MSGNPEPPPGAPGHDTHNAPARLEGPRFRIRAFGLVGFWAFGLVGLWACGLQEIKNVN